jgi:2-phosphosulfolactate phosphatase
VNIPHGQSQYQVRFDWGVAGAATIATDADVIVFVDVLSPGAPVDLAAELPAHPAAIVAGSLANAAAVASWALEQQGGKGDRFMVAVVAAGESRPDGTMRFALEDLLGAGAIIDALAGAGIDYCSPEAAAASAAFTGLRNATGHLIGASGTGRELAQLGRRDEVDRAIRVNSSDEVVVLREFSFPDRRSDQ